MDFRDQIKELGNRVIKLSDQLETEEATKNALIMPFIQSLGYDIFNPLEVVPEFVADLGTKKGEKVDYAIVRDGVPAIFIECKKITEKLDPHSTQLFRYFHATKAKFAILTNGRRYKFYTDLSEPNKMDEKPFLDFDVTDIKDVVIAELKKFHKSYFDEDKIFTTASELKYSNEIKQIMNAELNNPSPEFVKFFLKQMYNGRATEGVIEQFTEIVKKSLSNLISDIISERLKSALAKESEKDEQEALESSTEQEKMEQSNGIDTTEEELEGYHIIKAILSQKVEPDRVFYRDTKSYFGVILDDNNRKPICRLHFNRSQKYLGLFDQEKQETREPIEKLTDLYKYSSKLLEVADCYN